MVFHMLLTQIRVDAKRMDGIKLILIRYVMSQTDQKCVTLIRNQYKHKDGGWYFRVTLNRVNPKTSQRESVRLEPHPPYVKPTVLEAKHWGATYALYRV